MGRNIAKKMDEIIILEWSYEPPNYLEVPIHIVLEQYEMIIDNGKVKAKIKPQHYDKDPLIHKKLNEALDNRFLGVLILRHEPYKLKMVSMYRLYPNGRKHQYISPPSINSTEAFGRPNLIIKDKNGNIVKDSRRERIEKSEKLADLIEKYRGKSLLLETLLNSYKTSVYDPDNELFHLYEILDALKKEFHGKRNACKALNFSAKSWGRLGTLANVEPLKQGRHRGKNIGTLRDATEDELKEAHDIAQRLIESYLEYLENQDK